MPNHDCPYCHDQQRKLTRARYLFRADVRILQEDSDITTDKAIPVIFCPACGKRLPERNQPDKTTEAT